MRHALLCLTTAALLVAACDEAAPPQDAAPGDAPAAPAPSKPREPFADEGRFGALRQLTFGGQNAEAYWSFDETRLVFQATRGDMRADQIFVMRDDGSDVRMVSTGKGRTTCAYFLPGDERILFASTHRVGPDPKPTPRSRETGYVWPVWFAYDLFTVKPDGTDLRLLTDHPGYDAEATVSPKGDRIVFTSSRDGDLEIYTMAIDGTDVRRLTNTPGYDGGAFFSWDGTKIVWRAARPTGEALEQDRALLEKELVRPTRLDLWVMDADGSNPRRLTENGAANFGPSWHPDGKRVIFSSNLHDPTGTNFELYLVDVETRALERVTHFARVREGARWSDDFDGFPQFTRDGKRLVFCSNRFNDQPNETNVFVVEWRDEVEPRSER
jgi:Tol biopolymer transport system component